MALQLCNHDWLTHFPPVITVKINGHSETKYVDRCYICQMLRTVIRDHLGKVVDEEYETGAAAVLNIREHGGFADYNPISRQISFKDGTIAAFEDILGLNPGLTPDALHRMMRAEAKIVAKENSMLDQISGTREREPDPLNPRARDYVNRIAKLAEDVLMAKKSPMEGLDLIAGLLGTSANMQDLTTPKGATQVLAAHVKEADDSFAEGGKWLTIVTTAITEAIREGEGDEL